MRLRRWHRGRRGRQQHQRGVGSVRSTACFGALATLRRLFRSHETPRGKTLENTLERGGTMRSPRVGRCAEGVPLPFGARWASTSSRSLARRRSTNRVTTRPRPRPSRVGTRDEVRSVCVYLVRDEVGRGRTRWVMSLPRVVLGRTGRAGRCVGRALRAARLGRRRGRCHRAWRRLGT
jgi:hypothetical protein